MFGRRKIATLVAEFLGTGVLTLLILSVQRSTIGVPFFVALAAGLTIALMTFAVGALEGGFFNPAVTIGLWTARRLQTLNAVLYIAMQLLGAWLAYFLYTYFVKNGLQSVGGHFTARIMVAELVGSAIFSMGVAAAIYQGLSTGVRAAMVGLAYMVGIIAASSAAIGLLNPAVALGVRAWVWGTYVLGPVLGALIGVNLYSLVIAPAVAESTLVAAVGAEDVTPATVATARKTTRAKAKASATKRAATARARK